MKEYIDLAYEAKCDGALVSNGVLNLKDSIMPREEGKITLDFEVPEKGKWQPFRLRFS